MKPREYFPSPPIIDVPSDTPANVMEQIRKSYELFWSESNSCANRLRVGVEVLLDTPKIARSATGKNGKPVSLDLNGRIALFSGIKPDHAETLTALRMIRNLGSHGDAVSREPLLDAFEIFEDALKDLCGNRKSRLAAALRSKLIASKGKPG